VRTLQRYIEAKQQQFARHPFFGRLEKLESLPQLRAVASSVAYWVLNYQDFLRLNEDRVEDPAVRKIVRAHRAEEAGHEKWFTDDLAVLNADQQMDARGLFGSNYTPARDATHALLAEVYRARGDAERLAMLLVCEATSAVFFEKMDAQLRLTGLNQGLKFFSGAHPEAERHHHAFDHGLESVMDTFTLAGQARTSAFALVDRAFAAFAQLHDGMDVALIRSGVARRSTFAAEGLEATAA
jgi:hypothetical protein